MHIVNKFRQHKDNSIIMIIIISSHQSTMREKSNERGVNLCTFHLLVHSSATLVDLNCELPLSFWVIFLMARTVPPSSVEIGPKLRVLIPLTWEWPKRAKSRGEPWKMTPSSETEIFLGWSRWESCSPGYSGHLLHRQKSRSLYKKLTFGPKYPNFGVKKAHFRP